VASDIIVNVAFNEGGAVQGINNLNQAVNSMQTQTAAATKKATTGFRSIQNVLDDISAQQIIQEDIHEPLKSTNETIKRSRGAMLGLGLSILFAGMALKRMAQGALRSVVNTYQQAVGETHEFSVLTNQLTANWQFFKFTLMDALMQTGLFQAFIGFLISAINWFNQLGPRGKTALMVILGALVILGGAAMFLGQIFLLSFGISEALAISFGAALGGIFVVIGSIIAALVALTFIWTSDMSTLQKIVWSLISVLGIAAIAAFAVGASGLAGFLLIIAAIVAVIGLALAFKEELGIAFGFIVLGLTKVAEGIVNLLLLPLRAALWAAKKLAEALGMDAAVAGLTKVQDAIHGIRVEMAKLSNSANQRIKDLNTQRKNRAGFMDRTGLSGLFGSGPSSPDTSGVAGPKPSEAVQNNTQQNNDITIVQKEGENTDGMMTRLKDMLRETMEREVQSPQR